MRKFRALLACAIISVLALGATACSSSCSEKYNFIYDTRGGSEIASLQLSPGAKTKRPKKDPVKEFFVFDDWYADKACTEPFAFGSPMPASDVTVYAGWKDAEESVKVTLDANGGTFADGNATFVCVGVVGSAFASPNENPVNAGYTFGGWYLEAEAQNAYTFTEYPAENITLYARWDRNSDYAYVSYYGNGNLMTVVPVKKGAPVVEEKLFDEYTQTAGWHTDAALTQSYTFGAAAEEDVSLYTDYYTKGLTIVNGKVTAYNGASTEVTVPAKFEGKAVTAIGDYAFYRSTEIAGIQSVNLPETVTEIGEGAFYECRYLVTVNLSDKVTTVGVKAFFGNERLKSFGDLSSVTTIAAETFLGCKALAEVGLSEKVTSIGAQAFADCTLLKKVKLPATNTAEIAENAFDGCTAAICVPSALVQSYTARYGKFSFGKQFAAIND